MTALDAAGLHAAVIDHAAALGLFDRVAGHEPSNAPGRGLSCAVWVDDLRPIPRRSGLATTSARLAFLARVFRPLPAVVDGDRVDPEILAAASALIGSLIGDLDLGASVEVDVFGAHGLPLVAKPGYLTQDAAVYRVIDVTVPLIVDDLWPQAR